MSIFGPVIYTLKATSSDLLCAESTADKIKDKVGGLFGKKDDDKSGGYGDDSTSGGYGDNQRSSNY